MYKFHAARVALVLIDPEMNLTLSARQCRRVTKRMRKLGINMTSDYYRYYVA